MSCRKRKEQPGQQRLNWLRGAQRTALRGLGQEIERTVSRVLLSSNGGVAVAACLNVLNWIDDHAGARGACWASVETLAIEAQLSGRHVKRVLEVLDGEGLITQGWESIGGKRVMCRRIVWANVLPEDFVEPEEAGRTTVQNVRGHGDMAKGQGDMVSSQGDMVSEHTYIRSASEAPSPPAPHAPRRDGRAGRGLGALPPEWIELHRELQELGAEFPGDALREARGAGVPVGEVRERVDYWKAEKGLAGWGVRALVYSIEKSVPGQKVDKGWPNRKRGRGVESGAGGEVEAGRERGSVGDREREWGGELDRLAGSEQGREVLWGVLDRASGYLLAWAKRRWAEKGESVWRHPAVRVALLRGIEALATREAEETARGSVEG